MMRKLACLLLLPTLVLVACNEDAAADTALTFPEKGIVCDPVGGFCSDKVGISLGLSEALLGDTPAYKAFVAKYSKDDYASLQPQNYRFSDGTLCDHVEMWCGNPETGAPNEKVSTALFSQ